jgi:hypothetical protein
MLELYSAKMWALAVEKLILPPTASRSLEPFAERRKCANTSHSAFLKTTKAYSLSRHSAMLKPC